MKKLVFMFVAVAAIGRESDGLFFLICHSL